MVTQGISRGALDLMLASRALGIEMGIGVDFRWCHRVEQKAREVSYDYTEDRRRLPARTMR
jgi:hypothetical protein